MLLALLAMVVSVSMWGATVTGATGVSDPTITYQSVDANNNPITLSAKIYYKSQTINFVVLNCHPTITHNAGCPTGTAPQMEAIKYMVSEDALVVCPDYLGFGKTSGSVHPYMCSTLTARNVLDAYKAAIDYVTKTGGRAMSPVYYTINIGYSQGGATALAFHKYMETEATEADRKLVNLKGSVCGAGPYSQNIVFDEYEKMASLDYPIYLLYCLQGHKEAFGETTMRGLSLEECFTPEFWAACQGDNGFLAKLNAKETNVDDLNSELKTAGFTTFASIINADYANRSSKVYRIIQKTLNNSNLLKEDGWTPTREIIFYHDEAGHDIVVPYACTDAAMERFAGHCSYVDAIDDYGYDVTFTNIPLLGQVATTDKENYLWHAAVFNETWKNSVTYPGQNTVSGISSLTGMSGYKFQDLDHRAFGARFYAQFLAVRAKLRPSQAVDVPTMPSTIDLEVPQTSLALNLPVGATTEEAQATYNRVTSTLPDFSADKLTFMQFASRVDGFAFGWDAVRYKVTLNEAGEAVKYEPLGLFDDFEAGLVYAVSCKSPVTTVLSMTAGVQTPVVAGEQLWVKRNYRKLTPLTNNEEETRSYACAYLPFAYKGADGTDCYLVKEGNTAGMVTASPVGVVPAGTGALLINEEGLATEVVLVPDVDDEAGQEKGLLKGSYEPTPYQAGCLLFGKSNKGNVGFWKYSIETIPAYMGYLISGSNVKGMTLSLDDEADAITRLVETAGVEAIYSTDGIKRSIMHHGVNILRMEDGTVRKVVRK